MSPNQLVGDQKHERNNSQRAVLYIFQNIEISEEPADQDPHCFSHCLSIHTNKFMR